MSDDKNEVVTQKEPQTKRQTIKSVVETAVIIGVVVIAFTCFIFVTFVDGDSMNDTYHDGQMLLCRRIIAPKRGDVVIINLPNGNTLIKRVIAVGNDEINIDFDKGEVYVNGELLNEPYIKEATHLDEGEFEYPVRVPEDCYFVMGDNRNASTDSRDPSVGFVAKNQIKGTVICKL